MRLLQGSLEDQRISPRSSTGTSNSRPTSSNAPSAKSPQTQDAAFVYALSELDLRQVEAADAVIAELDAQALNSHRATGRWPQAIDALRGTALALHGQRESARALLDPSLAALGEEVNPQAPERLYVVASAAHGRLH
ncbi:hypothetical protein [Tahibacter caeni]|uniref:hypothetical protein n=1 Tax=Tahibacter caeni TaxID=1453545 RepID=UPI0021475808|nr:hypothetical protein [Tahibacter caeni]